MIQNQIYLRLCEVQSKKFPVLFIFQNNRENTKTKLRKSGNIYATPIYVKITIFVFSLL